MDNVGARGTKDIKLTMPHTPYTKKLRMPKKAKRVKQSRFISLTKAMMKAPFSTIVLPNHLMICVCRIFSWCQHRKMLQSSSPPMLMKLMWCWARSSQVAGSHKFRQSPPETGPRHSVMELTILLGYFPCELIQGSFICRTPISWTTFLLRLTFLTIFTSPNSRW